MSIYNIPVTQADGVITTLEDYRGKVLLIVNTASKCGLAPQFEGLEALYQRYKEQGLIVLGFPSNQFKQEVATSKEATEICRVTYGVSFPMYDITTINGKHAAPLFQYLTSQASGALGKAIKWNFTKFLVDRNGKVVARFAPNTPPEKLASSIETLLNARV